MYCQDFLTTQMIQHRQPIKIFVTKNFLSKIVKSAENMKKKKHLAIFHMLANCNCKIIEYKAIIFSINYDFMLKMLLNYTQK